MTKIPKIIPFSKIFCLFPQFLTDFVNWNFEKGQQGEKLLSSRVFLRDCSFLSENVSNWHQKLQKTRNFPIFKIFMHFLLKVRQTSWIGMFWSVNKEWVCCQIVFYEERIAMFWMKMSQIDTENDKNPRIYQVSKILCILSQIFDRLQTSSIETLKRVNKEKSCCPVGFP